MSVKIASYNINNVNKRLPALLRWLDERRPDVVCLQELNYWSYFRNRWPRQKGLRIDHFLLSPDTVARLVSGGVDQGVRGYEGASDHAPVWIKLKR